MKYYKKTDTGACGSMDDNGFVPNSVQILKTEYDAFVLAHTGTPKKQLKDILKTAGVITQAQYDEAI